MKLHATLGALLMASVELGSSMQIYDPQMQIIYPVDSSSKTGGAEYVPNPDSFSGTYGDCWVVTQYFPQLMCEHPTDPALCQQPEAFDSQEKCCQPRGFQKGCTEQTLKKGSAADAMKKAPRLVVDLIKKEVTASFDDQDFPVSAEAASKIKEVPKKPDWESSLRAQAEPKTHRMTLDHILTTEQWVAMFPNRNLHAEHSIYDHGALVQAAESFPTFANEGTPQMHIRELAAFLAHASQETSGWSPGKSFQWGLVYSLEKGCSAESKPCSQYNLCASEYAKDFPCAQGKQYFGRGPLMIRNNINYGRASKALFGDDRLLKSPDLVADDPTVAWRVALWQWMTPLEGRPSAHEVMIGSWSDNRKGGLLNFPGPQKSTVAASSFGTSISVIAGQKECGILDSKNAENRINYYLRYCAMLGVDPGDDLQCKDQVPFKDPKNLSVRQENADVNLVASNSDNFDLIAEMVKDSSSRTDVNVKGKAETAKLIKLERAK